MCIDSFTIKQLKYIIVKNNGVGVIYELLPNYN